ncbi:MAG: gfo/Idh/MocA family oxidoreductase [Paenibacillus sp.]|jgi:predicted dehydrogenase|nr:gfo/Idh/MocA family oxidoreductase [Paenibacillus sp.]
MLEAADAAGVKLAVNQNARFAPFYQKTKEIIDSGVLGIPYLMAHEMRLNQDAAKVGTWFAKLPHFLLVDYEIHHIDLMRYWSGQNPDRVYVSSTKMPGQHFLSDMIALSTLEFRSGLRATLTSVDTTQSDTYFFRFSVEGTKGSLYCGMEYGYKFPRLEYYSKEKPDEWIRPSLRGDWSLMLSTVRFSN